MARPSYHLAIISAIFLSLHFRPISAVRSNHGHDRTNLHKCRRTAPGASLRVRQEGSPFKIALFADLHFGENSWTEWGPQQDVNSAKVMSTVLDKEHPEEIAYLECSLIDTALSCGQLQFSDLVKTKKLNLSNFASPLKFLDRNKFDFVIYLGDVITANNIAIENASLYWDQALSPTRSRNIPWASVYGNHDDAPFEWPMEWFSSDGIPPLHCPATNQSDEFGAEQCSFRGTPRLELMRNEIAHNSLSYSISGPQNLWPSVSNYVLQLSSYNNPELPVAFMYFFDSGGGSYPEVISSAQAEWFRKKTREINPNSSIPEIIFWHIPSEAYKKVAPKIFPHKHCVGSIFMESVAPQEAEMGMMKLLEERPSVKAVFVGHNHGLDWCCPNRKLWLCFARHTGYGGYGNWPRGARILEITQQPFSLKSWIRMEDGRSHSEVILSSQ